MFNYISDVFIIFSNDKEAVSTLRCPEGKNPPAPIYILRIDSQTRDFFKKKSDSKVIK